MLDLHRHDMFSGFDGYGSPQELAALAKELGHTALSTSNHGNTNSWVQTYKACKEVGIKAVLGCEGYFLPKYKPQERGFHLCLFAKTLEGSRNINAIQYEGEKQKYFNPIWDFKILKENHKDIICTSACVASYSSQCIINGKVKTAVKYFKKMQEIFGDDFYIEIQPYKISEKGLQEKVNVQLIKIAKKLGIKCILTSDSHRGRKEDFPTYMKMHEMKGHDPEMIEGTYKERYMPAYGEMEKRFIKMHKNDFKDVKRLVKEFHDNLEELEAKIEDNILDGLELQLPKLGDDTWKEIVKKTKHGLKKRGKYSKEYLDRCKEELKVIKANGFIDYFLIVADYTNFAKSKKIPVGSGRGSVCNCLVAYALGITEVDSLKLDLDFRRFMRLDKKSFPDIDLDFATDRRDEVIEYLITKYKGHSARVASYGLYKVDNTINELAKICGLPTDKSVDEQKAKANKEIIAELKRLARSYLDDSDELITDELLSNYEVKTYNEHYDNIFVHFANLYNKVRYMGTHAAGIVITSGDILQYTALKIDKSGQLYAAYNLDDLNDINIIKFDLLGLRTMQSLGECWELTGRWGFCEDAWTDEKVMENFREGNTEGIFQFEKKTPREILKAIKCDSLNDVIAVNALNRPAALAQKMHEVYANNKANVESAKDSKYYKFAKESYGAIIYQEQLMLICTEIGGFTWVEADKMLKITKHGRETALRKFEEEKANGNDYRKKFFVNAKKYGLTKSETEELWESMLVYSFNKGHSAGYSLISVEEMYTKVYYPVIFWYVKIKYALSDGERERYCNKAVKDGAVVFLPHVNYSKPHTSIRKVDGEEVLQKGLSDLKDVGEKAAQEIYEERKKNGIFTSYDNFYDRCKSRVVTTKVIRVLQEQGALEFNKKQYIKKVITYNSSMYARA